MNDDTRVWIAKRKLKNGKASYHLRWVCPHARKWKSRKVGTDKRRADREAATLEKELAAGIYSEVRKTDWQAFVDDHVGKIRGGLDAVEARQALTEFGKACSPRRPTDVRFGMLETYVAHVEAKGNKLATINKKLRYLRAAFNKAVKRGFLAQNPMDQWEWTREDDPAPRIATEVEQIALLASAKKLYGARWHAFVHVALNTGGRRGELLALTWGRIKLDDDKRYVLFTETKGKRDRRVPIFGDTADLLLRLKAQTQQAGGPFIGMERDIGKKWVRIRKGAKVPDVTIHDLRRTYIAGRIQAGVELPTVQRLAGHASIQTTLKFYHHVSDKALWEGAAKKRQVAG